MLLYIIADASLVETTGLMIINGHSDPDPDPDWLRLHGGKVDSNPNSDHLSHVDCDPDLNPDSGPGARVSVLYLDYS